jgi:SAM-dependent methyltransferase
MSIKQFIKNIPVLGKALTSVYNKVTGSGQFEGSSNYWENRYAAGGNSGSGSYGRLAVFKANILNDFVKKESVKTVMEFGCGDGHQLGLAEYPYYTGLDVSSKAIERCKETFRNDSQKVFHLYSSNRTTKDLPPAELTLSLDVIYHLVENSVYEAYMRDLFSAATRFVIIYASNVEGTQRYHERTREFTKWIARHCQEWELFKTVPNAYPYNPEDPDNTSQSDFFLYRKK